MGFGGGGLSRRFHNLGFLYGVVLNGCGRGMWICVVGIPSLLQGAYWKCVLEAKASTSFLGGVQSYTSAYLHQRRLGLESADDETRI